MIFERQLLQSLVSLRNPRHWYSFDLRRETNRASITEGVMAYCSIDEAFPDPTDTGNPGRVARKEERRRAKTCKGPALAFLKADGDTGVDVDRQQYTPKHPAELLTRNMKPMQMGWDSEKEGFTNSKESGVDVIGSQASESIPLRKPTDLPKLSAEAPSYFGAGLDGPRDMSSAPSIAPRTPSGIEQFADYSSLQNYNPGYQLHPDFNGTFNAGGAGKAAGVLTAAPSLKDAWKPLTESGANTSFFEKLPWPGGRSHTRERGDEMSGMTREEKEMLVKRIDLLFAKLERLEGARNENATTEVALFVLSGLFLMFGMDVVRRTAIGL
jgi:hypothetical protein